MRALKSLARSLKDKISDGTIEFLLDPEAPQRAASAVMRAKVISDKARIIADKIDEDPAKAGLEAASSAIKSYGPMLMEHIAKKLADKARKR